MVSGQHSHPVDDRQRRQGAAHRLLSAFWRIVQAGILAYGLLVCGYLLARLAVGERWNLVALANNFVPWLAWGGLALAVIALFSRRRRLLVALQIPGLIAFLILYGELLLPRGTATPDGEGLELAAATYNLFG